MQIDPRHLVHFATIIEEGSFSGAAEKLGTSQPALSTMVKALEARTGLTLLSQRRRPVLPTEAGRELATKGQGIRNLLDEADRDTEETRKGKIGALRIGAPSFFCEHVLAERIISFRRKRPKVGFDIQTGYNLDLHRKVENCEIDMAFGPITADLAGARTHRQEMVSFGHIIVCRADHPLMKKQKVTLKDLQAADWISHSSESALFQVMQAELNRLGVTALGNAIKSNSASALMQLLHNTDCLSVLPVFSVLPSLQEGKLKIIKLRHRLPEVAFGLITQKHYSPTPLAEQFIAHVEAGLIEINNKTAGIDMELEPEQREDRSSNLD